MTDTDPLPRLFLVLPDDTPAERLPAILEAGDVACLLLRGSGEASRALVEAAQARGVAVLLADDAARARGLGADGVHLSHGGRVKATRAALGGDSIVGIDCGQSRHAAMLAGEADADYIAFSGRDDDPEAAADPDILAWWQATMTVPCVAMGDVGMQDVGQLAAAGADFIALERALRDHPDGPAAAVAAAQAAVETACAA